MPGKLDNNLRRAYLQEAFGVTLLQGFAAVAPVPTSQDYGIDVVATLLRADSKRSLLAEKPMYVQLKAKSVESLKYSGDELQWLRELQLPFFIGSVDLQNSKLSLYAAHRGIDVTQDRLYKEITLKLEERNDLAGQMWKEETAFENSTFEKSAVVYLGAPIFECTIQDMAGSEFLERTYAILAPFLELEQQNIRWRRLGFFRAITWATGEPATAKEFGVHGASLTSLLGKNITSEKMALDHLYDEKISVLRSELIPNILAWVSHSVATKHFEDWDTIEAMAALIPPDSDDWKGLDRFIHWGRKVREESTQLLRNSQG